ncbi:MAG: acyl carrier protein [Oscillospiraceae bacterium]|jgi:acyl carrier protein|nr:acyl carrier protein [Oscillospiraceae bacterium]
MTQDQITAKLFAIIAEQFDRNVSELTPETNLREEFGADSLDLVELTLAIEDEFGLDTNGREDELAGIVTIADAVRLISINN